MAIEWICVDDPTVIVGIGMLTVVRGTAMRVLPTSAPGSARVGQDVPTGGNDHFPVSEEVTVRDIVSEGWTLVRARYEPEPPTLNQRGDEAR